jgi:protein-disulfide isomerase
MIRIRLSRAGLVLVVLLLAVSPASADSSDLDSGSSVVGNAGGVKIRERDIIRDNHDAFEALKRGRDLQIHQANSQYANSYHDLLASDLDKILDQRALDMEAAQSKLKPDAILSQIKVPAVTDEEARAFYESRKDRTNQSFNELQGAIKQFLAGEHNEAATRTFYDELRRKHGIEALLEPYRVSVAAAGPIRGNANAPITIVEFADFQCPYCKRAESSLQTLINRYPKDVRLVFRNLPLVDLHPNAIVAAEAAVCANRQAKFWEMHDAMFNDQASLGVDGLKSTAKRLGLEPDSFSKCLDDTRNTAQVLDLDTKAAVELGINSTPYFFIDGRPLSGNAPIEQFEKLIEDERRRTKGS